MYYFDFSKLNLPREEKLEYLETSIHALAKRMAQQNRFSAILQNTPIITASQGNKNMDLFPPIYETHPKAYHSIYDSLPAPENPGAFNIGKISKYSGPSYMSKEIGESLLDGVENEILQKKASNIIENILDHSPVHITEHFRKRANNNDSGFGYTYVITISNAEPKITALSVENPWQKEASWEKEDLAVDIFFYEELTMQHFIEMTSITNIFPHWINILCSVMTFKGNEVFLNGKLFVPS